MEALIWLTWIVGGVLIVCLLEWRTQRFKDNAEFRSWVGYYILQKKYVASLYVDHHFMCETPRMNRLSATLWYYRFTNTPSTHGEVLARKVKVDWAQ